MSFGYLFLFITDVGSEVLFMSMQESHGWQTVIVVAVVLIGVLGLMMHYSGFSVVGEAAKSPKVSKEVKAATKAIEKLTTEQLLIVQNNIFDGTLCQPSSANKNLCKKANIAVTALGKISSEKRFTLIFAAIVKRTGTSLGVRCRHGRDCYDISQSHVCGINDREIHVCEAPNPGGSPCESDAECASLACRIDEGESRGFCKLENGFQCGSDEDCISGNCEVFGVVLTCLDPSYL